MGRDRFSAIAARIRRDLQSESAGSLPPIRELAARHGVSYRTMWKAAQLLAREGVITTRQGRKIESARHASPSAALILASHIRQGLTRGTYRAGKPLPKFDFFVHDRGVSRPTVAEAFRVLRSENLIHKIGKQWRAGPARQRAEGSQETSAFILLVVRGEKDWYELFSNFFLLPFINSLRTECAAHRVRLRLLFTEKPLRRSLDVPWGIDGARESARALKERLLGTIITDAFADRETITSIALEASAGKLPVAYLDTSGVRQDLDTMATGGAVPFHRLYVDDVSAVRTALAALVAPGHRTIGFPTQGPRNPDWLDRRLATARSLCEREFPDIDLLTANHTEDFWIATNEQVQSRFEEYAERLDAWCAPTGGEPVETPQRILLRKTPSMAGLLSRGATALVSSNDNVAYQQYLWCQNAGIAVPRDLSIVSFDNIPEAEVIPISTVDFGLGFLGYAAFHLLLGDIPVRLDQAGNVPGQCQLIDRGSIGRPGGRA